MKILHIDCSPRLASHSRRLSADIVAALVQRVPGATIVRRDLGMHPLPHADSDYAIALSSLATLAAPPQGSLDLSESLIEEVEAADAIVIGTPLNNLTVPSTLKAWLDQIIRAGRTFASTSTGKAGLLRDRPVFIGIAAGGVFTGERANQPDFMRPYLTAALGCIGLHRVQYFSVEATAFLDWDQAAQARDRALVSIDLTGVHE
jgi:FMN-dependent NADH-azoreductase